MDVTTRPSIRVLLAGMAPWQAEAVRDLLAADETLSVVEVTGNATEIIEQARSILPDVVLLNFYVPGPDGLETVRQLRVVAPSTRVVVLGDLGNGDEDFYRAAACDAGASAYLPWLSDRRAVIDAVRGANRVAGRPGPVANGR